MIDYNQSIISNKMFNFTYECAMRDATLQKAFNGKKDWIFQIEGAKNILHDYINKLMKYEFISIDDHDNYFRYIANSICEIINAHKPSVSKDSFSFGNAQKLINMTAKYLYIVCFHDPEIRSKFEFCHCPLDSILLDTVWRKFGEIYNDKMRREILGKHDDFCASWGDEGLNDEGNQPQLKTFPNRYKTFQNAIKILIGNGTLYPIEYDYLFWNQHM